MINVTIDLSHAQSDVNFLQAAADGIVAVIHKATQGTGFVDPRYQPRTALAADAGLLYGAYHFGTGDGTGEQQADFFLAQAAPATLLVLDFEENPRGTSMTLEQARAFVSRVHDVTGRWPGLYAGHYLAEQLGDAEESVLTNCWFWLAQYAPAPTRLPPQWPDWTFWQYTDGASGPTPHSVVGVGPCDRDQFNGDLDALRALFGAAPPTVASGTG